MSLSMRMRLGGPLGLRTARNARPALQGPVRTFGYTRMRLDDKKDEKKEQKEYVHGRSPFQVFVDVLKDELKKSRDLQDSVHQLQGETSKFKNSESMKRAMDMYERTRLLASIQENPQLQSLASELRKAGISVNGAVATAVKSFEENALVRQSREALNRAASAAYDASAPVRNTEAYKTFASEITEVLDDAVSNMQFGGYVEKDERQRRRQARLERAGKRRGAGAGPVTENADAGTGVQLHATANVAPSSALKTYAPKFVGDWLEKQATWYREHDGPLAVTARQVGSAFSRWFADNEAGKVSKRFKDMDPTFNQEDFLRELREYIVPEVSDAFVANDKPALEQWLSEAAFIRATASLEVLLPSRAVNQSQVLDLKNVDIASSQILEDLDIPVYIVSWHSQEMSMFVDVKTMKPVDGFNGVIINCIYVGIITRVPELVSSPETAGWKFVDFGRRVVD